MPKAKVRKDDEQKIYEMKRRGTLENIKATHVSICLNSTCSISDTKTEQLALSLPLNSLYMTNNIYKQDFLDFCFL